MKIKIGNKHVGDDEPCFIIAEVSCNHQQKFDNAVEIIKSAAYAGADAVKLQTYTPDTMTLNSDKPWFIVGGKDNPETWQKKTFYELYAEGYMPWEWHADLKKIAESLGLILFSTPFDATAVDFLEKLNVPCYKIASYESTDIPLIKKIASKKKPVIISIGFADLEEVDLAIKTLKENGSGEIVCLQCTTSYSTKENAENTNLQTMLDIKKRYNILSGLSDNMGEIEAPALAAAMGASIIEKHIVVKHDPAILDDRFSLDRDEFKQMVDKIRRQEKLAGKVAYGPQTEQERYNRNFRRSLFSSKDIMPGEAFSVENIRCVRPGYGLAPKYFEIIIGKRAKVYIERGTPISVEMIEERISEDRVNLRLGEEEDCLKLYQWRNEPKVRAISFSSEEIAFEDHQKWFHKMINDPKRTLFIVMNENKEDIGNIRFDKDGDHALVNIVIGGEFTGKGYGTRAINKATKLYLQNFDVDYIIAEIKKDNLPSVKSFSGAGYGLHAEHSDKYEYRAYRPK